MWRQCRPRQVLLEGRAFFALIFIIIVFSFLSPNYFSLSNFLTMANHVAIYGLLSIGMLLVILNGGIDLSVGSALALAGVIAGALMQGVTLSMFGVVLYPPVWAVVVLTCVLGGCIGAVNGVLIAYLRVPAFVATLGTLYVARGVALLMTNGLTYNNLSGRPELGNTGFDWLGFNRLAGVPIGVLVLAVVAVVCHLMLTRTAFGRWLYASGGNERAADLSGVPVKRVKITRLRALRHLCRHRRPRALLAAHLGRPDRRHHLRTDGDRSRGDRRRGPDGRPRDSRWHDAGRLRHRLPLGRAGDRRRLRLLADRVHRRGHRPRRAAQQHPVRARGPEVISTVASTSPQRPRSSGSRGKQRRMVGITPEKERHLNARTKQARAAGRSRRHTAPGRHGLGGGPDLDHRDRPVEPLLADRGQGRRGDGQGDGLYGDVAAHKGDTNTESNLIDTAITNKSVAIILDPANADGSVGAVKKAVAANIPVFLVNAEINQDGLAKAQLVSNNAQGAAIGAQQWVESVGDKGKYVELFGNPADNNAATRSNGYETVLTQYPDLEKSAQEVANWDRTQGFNKMQSMLQANPDIVGVISGNDEMALGAIAALKEAGKLDQIKVGGFDGSPDAVAAVKAGEMQYTVLQPVATFSAEAVRQADSFIKTGKTGADSEKQLFDCILVTKDNVDDFTGPFTMKQ